MGSGGCYDQSLTQDAGELIVPVVGGVAGAQDPLERDCGADAAFARHLAEDLQDLLAAEDLTLALPLPVRCLLLPIGCSNRFRSCVGAQAAVV